MVQPVKDYETNPDIEPVPSGSVPIGQDKTEQEQQTQEQPQQEVSESPEEGQEEEIPEKFKGKDAKDIAVAYTQLEEKLGQQGAELGTLRQQNELLMGQLQELQQRITQAKDEQPGGQDDSFDAELANIKQQVADGNIAFEDALQQIAVVSARHAAEQGAKMAEQRFREYEKDKEARTVYERFVEQNPDFPELVRTGALEQVKGPEDDNLSAYWKYKALQLQKQAEEATKQAYEQGKKEVKNIKDGTEVTTKVLAKPGAEIRDQNVPKKPLSEAELEQELLDALKSAGGG